ncbi:MAG: DUF167 domain-containing protein [Phycisphaerae bacterium]|jgi:hypothetical protein
MAATPELAVTDSGDAIEFQVKVVPGASRDRIAGLWNGALRVTVSAPPERGRANEAVVALLAKRLGVGRGEIAVVAGETQPLKRVRVRSCDAATARQRLRPTA